MITEVDRAQFSCLCGSAPCSCGKVVNEGSVPAKPSRFFD